MALTIKVNGLTLCHKGSGGISIATAGGVKSGTFKGKATWLSFSMNVKMEGRPVCRLTDKMLMNDGNTVNLAGLIQAPLETWNELMAICALICRCDQLPLPSASGESDLKQECVTKGLIAADDAAKGMSPIKAEIPYNMTTVPPTPITTRQMPGFLRSTQYLPRRMKELGLLSAQQTGGIYEVRRPDAVVTRTSQDISNKALTAPDLKAAVEIKFNQQPRDQNQIRDYAVIAGDEGKVVALSPAECKCDLSEPERASALEAVREQAADLSLIHI